MTTVMPPEVQAYSTGYRPGTGRCFLGLARAALAP